MLSLGRDASDHSESDDIKNISRKPVTPLSSKSQIIASIGPASEVLSDSSNQVCDISDGVLYRDVNSIIQ